MSEHHLLQLNWSTKNDAGDPEADWFVTLEGQGGFAETSG